MEEKKNPTQNDCCEDTVVHNNIVSSISDHMPPIDTLFALSELFKVFGDITRIRILCALFEHEMCVCDISKLLNMGQSAISHQLRLLRHASLVTFRKAGKSCFYSLADDHVRLIFEQGLNHIKEKEDS